MSRTVTLPTDPDNTPASKFVYLPREVLNNEPYFQSADVYGFGVLMFEVISQQKAFARERSWVFSRFTEHFDPVTTLLLDTNDNECIPEPVSDLIKDCVRMNLDERPFMACIIDKLREMKENLKTLTESPLRKMVEGQKNIKTVPVRS